MPVWAWALLMIWAVLLFGGLLFGRPTPKATRRMPTSTRMLSSLTLVAAALGWSWAAQRQGSPFAVTTGLVAGGMFCGWLGDLTLAGLIRLRRRVLAGMALFGLGHLAYIVGLLQAARHLLLNDALAWQGSLLVWGIVAVIGWYVVVWRGDRPTLLHRAALPYALLLAATAAAGSALAAQDATFLPVALGAALFLLSDLILAGELFGDLDFPNIGDIIWLLYGPGQALIVFGTGLASTRLLT